MLVDIMKKTVLTGLGLAAITKEKAEEIVSDLVKQGELSKDEGRQLVDSIIKKADAEKREIRGWVQQEVKKVLDTMGFATKADLDEIKARLERLEGGQ